MRSQRFLELTLAAIVALALGAAVDCAFAQSSPRQIVPQKKSEARRPARPSKVDHAARLDALYEALKRAPTATVAKVIENRIDAIMLRSGSDTADLLMTRARAVMEQKEYDLSISLLDTVIELRPDFTEAFAQRATVHYLKKNIARSLADLRVVIAREPRHYASLAGLGVILQDIGEDRRALEAFRRAIAINPHIQAIPELIKRLEVKVEGREI